MIKITNWEDILKMENYVKDVGSFYELETSPPIKVDKVKMMAALRDYKKVAGNRTNAGISNPEDVNLDLIDTNSTLFGDFVSWVRENRIGDS